MAVTVRIEPSAHRALTEIARAKRLSLTETLSRAVEMYRREVFLEGLAADFAAFREDESAWAQEEADRAAWDATLADGLEAEPTRVDARRRAPRAQAPRPRPIRAKARRA